jgi:hypothetical protein
MLLRCIVEQKNENLLPTAGVATLAVGPEHKTILKVVYSDESGTGGDLNKEPITVVAAMLLNIDTQWIPVRDAVEDALREVYNLSDSEMARYAIKGKILYHKLERGDAKAIDLVARLLAIPKQQKILVWYGAVDRDGYYWQMENLHLRDFNYRDPNPLFRIAFEHCMNRVDGIMRSLFPDEQVLWIHDGGSLDEHAKGTLRDLRSLLKEIREEQKQHPPGTPFHSPLPVQPEDLVTCVADMIYFGNDKESRLLQLVDVCCSTITRMLRKDGFVMPYYEILRSQVLNDGTRPNYENARVTVAPIRATIAKRRAERALRAKKAE